MSISNAKQGSPVNPSASTEGARGTGVELPVGRELDALIASRVFGLVIGATDWPCGPNPECGYCEAALNKADPSPWHRYLGPVVFEQVYENQIVTPVRRFSTDIDAAWQVVKEMREQGFIWELCAFFPPDTRPPYGASFVPYEKVAYLCYDDTRDRIEQAFVLADTTPLAICRAALAAVQSRENLPRSESDAQGQPDFGTQGGQEL